MSKYRTDRSLVLVIVGVMFIVAAVAVFAAFAISPWFWLLVVAVLGFAAVRWLRPPVAVTLDPGGYHSSIRTGTERRGKQSEARRFEGTWTEVENADLHANVLTLQVGDGLTDRLPLQFIERKRRVDLVKDVYERLNAANGYQRFHLQ